MKKEKLFSILMCIFMVFSLVSCSDDTTVQTQGREETGAKYTMPDVTGKEYPEAEKILQQAGFTNITCNITDQAELEANTWVVVSQSVPAGESWVYNKKIVLVCKKYLLLYLDLKSEGNWFFSKYDVDISVDGKAIGSVSNGADFTQLINVLEGTHEIKFSKAGNADVAASKSLDMTANTTFQCTIAHDRNSIELKNQKITENVKGAALEVPDVVGKLLPEATEAMKSTGFINVSSYAENDSIWIEENWIVVNQNYDPGTVLDKTTKMSLQCMKIDQFIEKAFTGKNLKEIAEIAEVIDFQLTVKDKDTGNEVSLSSLDETEMEYYTAVSADGNRDKTAKVYVRYDKPQETVKEPEQETTTTEAVEKIDATEENAAVTTVTTETASVTSTTTTTAAKYLDNELKINYPRPSGNPNLKKGSTGDGVRWLQAALNIVLNQNDTVDGQFGGGTYADVIEFQSRAGLTADGAVGPKTIETIVDVATGKTVLSRFVVTTTKVTTTKQQTYTTTTATRKVSSTHFILNTKTKKIHMDGCRDISTMNSENKKSYTGSYQALISQGYTPCGHCHPNKFAD